MSKKTYSLLVLLLGSCLLILSQYNGITFNSYPISQVNTTLHMKTILFWTPMFERKDWYLGLGSERFKHCTYKNCYLTDNKKLLPIDAFDAILFHGKEYTERRFGKPKKRDRRQVYIFGNLESPSNTPEFIKDQNNFYNWTMTYRLDSDLVRTYGEIRPRTTNYTIPSVEEIRRRPKKIAWFVSHCQTTSQRELLYERMNNYTRIDVYGKCYGLKCPRNLDMECYDMLENEYKFYLSFENSLCEEYVTEKLYNVLRRNVVPIVYGGANYRVSAPPHSVINVMDFKSVGDLMGYVKYLDDHPEEYLKYFEWKKKEESVEGDDSILCELCRKLNGHIQHKTYRSIAKWWFGEKHEMCDNNFITNFL